MFSALFHEVNFIITEISLALMFYSQDAPLPAKKLVQVNFTLQQVAQAESNAIFPFKREQVVSKYMRSSF